VDVKKLVTDSGAIMETRGNILSVASFSRTLIFVLLIVLFISFVGCASTPLTNAARDGDVNSVRGLLDGGTNVNETSFGDARNALDWAVEKGHADVMRLLIERGAKTNYYGSALHGAARFGHTDQVRMLVEMGMKVNAQDDVGHTPLHMAIWNGHLDIVHILLTNGAITTIGSRGGYTPMDYAQKKGRTTIIRMLKEAEEERYLSLKQPSPFVPKTGPVAEKPDAPAAASPIASPSVPDTSLDFGSYHALVVGNNNYQNMPKLRTAINDARDMADLLQAKYGFNVRLLVNATRMETLKAIYSYRRTLTNRDNLLIYYAGHGWLDKEADEGYWLPVDAEKQDPGNWISNSTITSTLRAMRAKHVLVVADSCYSGKLARGISVRLRTSDYYQRISRKKARSVMASGGLEPVADEGGNGKHSVFASSLIEVLKENQGVLDATLLFSKIRRPVMLNADQTPEYSDIRKAGHDGGDFLFIPR